MIIGQDHVIRSINPDLKIPRDGNLSISEFFRSSAPEETLDDVFLVYPNSQSCTRREVLADAERFGEALRRINVLVDGAHVGILLPNVPEYFSIFLGIIDAKMVAIPFNPAYTSYELKSMLKSADIKLLVTLPELLASIEDAVLAAGVLKIVTLGPEGAADFDYNDMIKSKQQDDLEEILQKNDNFDGDKTAVIMWSSGTSGLPKGVMVSHKAFVTEIVCVAESFSGEFGREDAFSVVPWFHVGGLTALSVMFYRAWKTIVLLKFDPSKYVKILKEQQPTMLWLVPTLAQFIVNESSLSNRDFKRIHTVIFGAAPSGSTLLQKLKEKIGQEKFYLECYGCTEFSGCVTILPKMYRNIGAGSAGVPVPNACIKIVSLQTKKDLPAYEQGEVCAKGPMLMKGYYGNPEATADAIDHGGWYYTGDLGHYDDNGLLYIDGRIKDLIKVNGFQVSPDEIENVIRTHEKVGSVVVFGVPDIKYGQVPSALVVPKRNNILVPKEIQDWLKDKLAPYKQLLGGVTLVSELPTSKTGKVLRREAAATAQKIRRSG